MKRYLILLAVLLAASACRQAEDTRYFAPAVQFGNDRYAVTPGEGGLDIDLHLSRPAPQALHITLPGLMPTFLVLFLLSVANFMSTGFQQYFIFQNSMVANKIEVLDLYIYKQGLKLFDYSYSTAIGIIKSIISIVLLFFANYLARKVRGTNIF